MCSRPRTQAQVLSNKKKVFTKIFQAISKKKKFFFQALHKILTIQKIVLSSSRGQANFRGLEASRPRPKTSKCVLEDSTSDLDYSSVYNSLKSAKNVFLFLLLHFGRHAIEGGAKPPSCCATESKIKTIAEGTRIGLSWANATPQGPQILINVMTWRQSCKSGRALCSGSDSTYMRECQA